MYNYKLTLQYDGTGYAGWQIQNNVKTVQGEITSAIETIVQSEVNLIGSGRTDSGVHALGQVANFRCEKKLDLYRYSYSLNTMLPKDISITKMEEVDSEFHARFDARRRSYLYLITHSKNPFWGKYSYQFAPVLDYSLTELNKLSKALIGEYDFTSFCRANTEIENKNCQVFDIHWKRTKDQTIFFIEANRFLHGMVRTIVGNLLYCAKNNLSGEYLIDVLKNKDRTSAAEAVPAQGLFLFKVRY